MQTGVAIIGGGLAGLYAGKLIRAEGTDFRLIEARERLGGRILSIDTTRAVSDHGVDLGPSMLRVALVALGLLMVPLVVSQTGAIAIGSRFHVRGLVLMYVQFAITPAGGWGVTPLPQYGNHAPRLTQEPATRPDTQHFRTLLWLAQNSQTP